MGNTGPADGGGSKEREPLFPEGEDIVDLMFPVGKEGTGKTTLDTDPIPKWRPKRRIPHASDVAREEAQCDTKKDDKATETRRTIVCDCTIVLNWDTHAAQLFLCPLHEAASDMLAALEAVEGLAKSYERNKAPLLAALQQVGIPSSWLVGWEAKFEKVAVAIAAAKKGTKKIEAEQ